MIEKLKDRDVLILVASVLGLGLVLSLVGSVLALLPEPIGPAAQQFADGALMTVELTLWSAAFGLILGLLAGVGKGSRILVFRWTANFYVWVLRGTPLVLQILFFCYGMPEIAPQLKLPEFWTAVLALSLNVGAYNAEVIRAGIAAVPRGQIEAARSLGITSAYTFWDVVLPQAVRISLPALANNMIALLKDSSLAYSIGVVELTLIGNRVGSDSFRPDIVLPTIAAVYLALTTTFTQFAAALERKLAVGKR